MKILINGGTHGTEQIGANVINHFRKLIGDNDNLHYTIANPEALSRGVRFIESDLNRVFPGKPDGSFEERIAYNLHPVIKSYDVVIDIHSTESGLRSAIIITKVTEETIALIRETNAKYVLLMDITKGNSLISDARIGIGFEYGPDTSHKALSGTIGGISLMLKSLGFPVETTSKPTKSKVVFRIGESLPKRDGFTALNTITNYTMVQKGQPYAHNAQTGGQLTARNDFYPILFNEPRHTDIFGFVGQREHALEEKLRRS